jgi:hypothetical protein
MPDVRALRTQLARPASSRHPAPGSRPGVSLAPVSALGSRFSPEGTGEVVRLLEHDPELGEGLDLASRAAAGRIAVRALPLPVGDWEVADPADAGTLGLLVLDGLLVRWVTVGDVRCCELLGAGDVLRPWTLHDPAGGGPLPAEAQWRVVEAARIAVLDRRFALQVARWPEITATIVDRVVVRARRLAFHVSVCSLVRLELRLLVVLWHFADRWGRVTPRGVHLPLRIGHELLAGIVGARRPSVTVALGRLRETGSVVRRPDRTWLLAHDPPPELLELRRTSALGDRVSLARP